MRTESHKDPGARRASSRSLMKVQDYALLGEGVMATHRVKMSRAYATKTTLKFIHQLWGESDRCTRFKRKVVVGYDRWILTPDWRFLLG